MGKQYAVLIAIDRYQEWTNLRNPVKDARALKDILEKRYYIDEFIELYDADASAAGIRQLFSRLIDTVGPTDSVLVYYAGHGFTDRFNTGFWIPSDGGSNRDSQDRWIPNQQIRNFVTQMKARSVAPVAEACFSGDLLNVSRGATPILDSAYYRNAVRLMSRQVLTSGASETVPDESEFARQFQTFLANNNEPYVDPYAIYDRVRRGITQTIPLLGTLPGQEQGGSFVLFLKDTPGIISSGTGGGSPSISQSSSSGISLVGDAFAHDMNLGDKVLVVAHHYPCALVEVTGEYNYIRRPEDELGVWFRHLRRVQVLGYYADFKTNPSAWEQKTMTDTISRLKNHDSVSYKLIQQWLGVIAGVDSR